MANNTTIDVVGTPVELDKDFFTGKNLQQVYKKTYGFDWDAIPATYHEVIELDRHKDIMKLINVQKVYHITGLVKRFSEQGVSRYKVEIVQGILIQRGLLKAIPVAGLAKATLGIILICTPDCTQGDIYGYLNEFNAQDELRMIKQIQRSKDKKKPITKDEYKKKLRIPKEAAKEVAAEMKAEEDEEAREMIQQSLCPHSSITKDCRTCQRARNAYEARLAVTKRREQIARDSVRVKK